jgi:hypothetical protein
MAGKESANPMKFYILPLLQFSLFRQLKKFSKRYCTARKEWSRECYQSKGLDFEADVLRSI